MRRAPSATGSINKLRPGPNTPNHTYLDKGAFGGVVLASSHHPPPPGTDGVGHLPRYHRTNPIVNHRTTSCSSENFLLAPSNHLENRFSGSPSLGLRFKEPGSGDFPPEPRRIYPAFNQLGRGRPCLWPINQHYIEIGSFQEITARRQSIRARGGGIHINPGPHPWKLKKATPKQSQLQQKASRDISTRVSDRLKPHLQ